jgi:peptide/nickel transport system permease protein
MPLVLGVATLLFFVIDAAPGDPALYLVGPGMTREVVEQVRTDFALDRPVHVRYVRWMASVLTGDLGQSFSHHRPVVEVLLGALPATLLLSGCALLLAFLAGIVVGTVQAVRQHSPVDTGLSLLTLFFYSMPSFWLALMMMLLFGYVASNVWGWGFAFPVSGMQAPDFESLSAAAKLKDRAFHLALPVASLALAMTGGIARYVRSSLLEVIRQDYIRTARAKGLSERSVITRHALRNALLPVATLLGLYLPVLFSGAVFIEEVFAWPGMGRALVGAIQARDYPLVMGGGLLFAAMVVAGNLLADLLYALVDPRVRYE